VVRDEAGRPLAQVDVELIDILTKASGRYGSPLEYKTSSDADGRFRFAMVPLGSTRVWVHKPGYCRPGLGPTVETPADNIELQMVRSAQVRVTVDFSAVQRPSAYIVNIEPEGGNEVGSWGGSGLIDTSNQMSFADVPPGKYFLTGRPNPGSDAQQAGPVTVELKGGDSAEILLTAK
jgi:hypothetical protein